MSTTNNTKRDTMTATTEFKRFHRAASEAQPYHLFIEPSDVACPSGMAAMFAGTWAADKRTTLLVSTRDEETCHRNTYTLYPEQIAELSIGRVLLELPTDGGAVLVIDAEPIYSDGRVLRTIQTARVVEIAKAVAQALPGGALHAIQIICDVGDRDAIAAGMAVQGVAA